MRVAICWIGVSGYLAASWRALCAMPGLDVKVFFTPAIGTANAPFAGDIAQGVNGEALTPEQAADPDFVATRVAAHQPHVIVIPGWVIPGFSALPFRPEFAKTKFVMGMDTPRKHDFAGALRQRLAKLKLRKLLARMDRMVVPGERSWQYARFLGFPEHKIRRGVYGIDVDRFAPVYDRRAAEPWPKRFLFSGRYEEIKGIECLAAAYQIYRSKHGAEAWPLTCSGKGPLADKLRGPGVEDLGFVQPADQPELWARCGAFVIASRFDPWPLVIVEACAAGLPVLCTEACGSAVELVRPHFNGLTVATDDPADLARGFAFIHASYDRLPEMGRRGQALAAAYSTAIYAVRWAAMFHELIEAS